MQYDLNGKPILRIGDSTPMVTQKNADGTTTLWRAGVMYTIAMGDPFDLAPILERQERIKEADLAIRQFNTKHVSL